MEFSHDGPIMKARNHAEVVTTNAAVSPLTINVEHAKEDADVSVDFEDDREDLSESFVREDGSSNVDEIVNGWPSQSEELKEAFENDEYYQDNNGEHIHDGPIVCLDTDSKWDDLLVSTNRGKKTLFCALCGKRFSSSKKFLAHQLKHRSQDVRKAHFSEAVSRPKVFECKDCGKSFSSIGMCLNHQRSHKQASKSVFHQLAHLKKKSFQCQTCGRCYSRASALDAHRRCHEIKLVKSKSCETDKALPLDESLSKMKDKDPSSGEISQTLEETEQKLFHCSCGKSFRTMCGLGTHQRFSASCSKVKVKEEIKHSFGCSECGKTFVSSTALTCHQRWHKRRAYSNGQPYKCKECDRVFTSLTFYNKHHRMAHTKELPAKSFLQQVCQLKKNAFECQDCGRRFSRASALQSHMLCHTDVFDDMMKKCSETSSATESTKCPPDYGESFGFCRLASPNVLSVQTQEKEFHFGEKTVEKAMVGDYEVVHVTDVYKGSSGLSQDPDLELVCESDQDEKYDADCDLSQTPENTSQGDLQPNPDIDVKIVKIGYDSVDEDTLLSPEIRNDKVSQNLNKYKCPFCERTFAKTSSLRCHVLWHRGIMGKKVRVKQEICLSPSKTHSTPEESDMESPSKTVLYRNLEIKVPYKSMTYQLENLQKDKFNCDECGKCFSRLSALHSHQQLHSSIRKPFACMQCSRSYATPGGLCNHKKVCCGSVNAKDEQTKHFNPTKSLLGPKVFHCKKCGKGFWSLGAFYHHKQNHSQCADMERNKPDDNPDHEISLFRRRKKGRRGGFRGVHRKNTKEEHKCEVCGKSYLILSCFLKHKLVHDANGLQPAVKSFDYQVQQLKKNSYQCHDCGKVFSRAMALQFHMKSHGFEAGFPQPDVSSQQYQCQTCQALFMSESQLKKHQRFCLKQSDNLVVLRENKDVKNKDFVQDAKAPSSVQEDKAPLVPDLKYKCLECNRSFSVIGGLNFHKRIHGKVQVSKKRKSMVQQSMNTVKVKQEPTLHKTDFLCPECGRYFCSNSALGTHRRWHKDKKFATFLSKTNNIRSRKSLDGGPYLCNLCGKGFFYLCVLRRHQLHHPSQTDKSKKQEEIVKAKSMSYNCPDCHESFSSGSLLTNHFSNHHAVASFQESQTSIQTESDPPVNESHFFKMTLIKQGNSKMHNFQCSQCERSFLSIRGLRAHKWQKHFDMGEESDECEKPFGYKGACESPQMDFKAKQSDTAKEPNSPELELSTKCFFKCDKCGKAFPTEEQLTAHKEVSATRPHCCALCCRGYWTETQLQQHLAWHDEVRQRLPTELRYKLLKPGSLDQPKVKHHAQRSNPKSNSHKCQHCGKTFLSPRALQQHQDLHKNSELHSCSKCSQSFFDVRSLISHHQECLSECKTTDGGSLAADESLSCTECGVVFTEEADLHQHYIEHARGTL